MFNEEFWREMRILVTMLVILFLVYLGTYFLIG